MIQVGCPLRSEETSLRHGNACCGSIGTDGYVRSAAMRESERRWGSWDFSNWTTKRFLTPFRFPKVQLVSRKCNSFPESAARLPSSFPESAAVSRKCPQWESLPCGARKHHAGMVMLVADLSVQTGTSDPPQWESLRDGGGREISQIGERNVFWRIFVSRKCSSFPESATRFPKVQLVSRACFPKVQLVSRKCPQWESLRDGGGREISHIGLQKSFWRLFVSRKCSSFPESAARLPSSFPESAARFPKVQHVSRKCNLFTESAARFLVYLLKDLDFFWTFLCFFDFSASFSFDEIVFA